MHWKNWKQPETICQFDAENNFILMCKEAENEFLQDWKLKEKRNNRRLWTG
jgi:hypothetical protein